MIRRIAAPLVLFALLAGACNSASVLTLEVGDCFDDPSSFDEVSSVDTVDCADPHDNEVYAVLTYTETPSWPGDEAMQNAAFDGCLEAFESFVGVAYEVSRWDIAALWPSQESWDEAGDREIICAVYDLNGVKVTGSARGSAE